jgi:uncharacterized membrane protein
MTLAPLLDASPQIQVHAFAAIAAFGLGLVQLSAPKGTLPHRSVGWVWAALMLVVCVSSFFIHQIRMWGPWSPIHLLSIFVLIMLPDRGDGGAAAHGREPSPAYARALSRCAGDRRGLHVLARPHHARSCIRELSRRGGAKSCCVGCYMGSAAGAGAALPRIMSEPFSAITMVAE